MKQKVLNRRNEIIHMVKSEGEASVSEMAERFNVTTETIRSDFDALYEEQGWVRTYGGVKLEDKESTGKHYVFHEREGYHIQTKKNLCYQAIQLVSDGDCVYIDSGSTVIYLLSYLNLRKNLTIVTHSIAFLTRYVLDGYEETFKTQGHRLLFLGGEVDSTIRMTFGSFLEEGLSNIHCDHIIFSVDGLHMEHGCTNMDLQAYAVAKAAINRSKHKILLASEEKFEQDATFEVAKWKQIDYLITNRQLSEDWKKCLDDNNVQYFLQ